MEFEYRKENFRSIEQTIVYLSRFFGKNLTSLEPIREGQDSEFVENLRKMAIEKMGDVPILSNPKAYYLGSIDYMVVEGDNQHKFVILESNGGSSRGLLSLHVDQIEMLYRAFKTAIDQSSENPKKLVLIGVMPIDDLLQEKIMLIEFLKKAYQREGIKVAFYHALNYPPLLRGDEDITIIISDYNSITPSLIYEDNYIKFKGEKVNVLIGDGIARRFPTIAPYVKKNWNAIKTTILNPIYHVTDDKFNTYVAIALGEQNLSKYRIHPLKFGKFFDRNQLEAALENLITTTKKSYIIKPFGGSGGAGIQPILKGSSIGQIPKIIDQSISEFHQKFDPSRDPFPYTIQEMADFILFEWKGSKRTFDIRIYVAQQDNKIIPVGGEARIARAPFTGNFAKNEFVVNICGDWGVEFERAIPFSPSNLKLLNLTVNDVIDMFCAACTLFSIIIDKHQEILAFKDWEKYLK